jgi:hypothetical protein
MWDDIVKHLPDFASAVLTGVDAEGYPCSVRCKPEIDTGARVLRVQVPEYAAIQLGCAGLLCHRHDEQLWNLKSFLVRGFLEKDAHGWLFRPQQFTPGAGIGGMIAIMQFMLAGKRTAQQYLDKRGLARPSIPWDRIRALWAEVRREKR